jgi:amidase
VLVDPVRVVADGAALGAAEYERLLHEFKAGLNAYLAARGRRAEVPDLAALIAFNRATPTAGDGLVRPGAPRSRTAARRPGQPGLSPARASCHRLAWSRGSARRCVNTGWTPSSRRPPAPPT